MIPTTPRKQPGVFTIVACNQPEYLPLPAYISATGVVTTEWTLSEAERAALLAGGRIKLQLLTFNQPLQPIMLGVVDAPCPAEIDVH